MNSKSLATFRKPFPPISRRTRAECLSEGYLEMLIRRCCDVPLIPQENQGCFLNSFQGETQAARSPMIILLVCLPRLFRVQRRIEINNVLNLVSYGWENVALPEMAIVVGIAKCYRLRTVWKGALLFGHATERYWKLSETIGAPFSQMSLAQKAPKHIITTSLRYCSVKFGGKLVRDIS